MMGYKVGDEVLLKVACVKNSGNDAVFEFLGADGENYMICPHTSSIYKPDMTAEEAWEIARKIVILENEGGIPAKDMVHMFGVKFPRDIVREYSVQEVKTKIEAWEAENEIKVGDEVDICGDKGIVTSFGTDGDRIHVLYLDGIVNSYRRDKDVKKTGRHIDIDGLLKQIGGDE